ncbi:MAG TPA: deaminase domain-containing protein [Nostocaceae cyanobacterium]|nr:deaminase domain-containing protein [Nostocaceae cyanobacterium]
MLGTQDNFFCPKVKLRKSAREARERILPNKEILNQPFSKPRNNVAVAEVQIQGKVVCYKEATSNYKSPIPQPLPKSEGGRFEPRISPRTNRMMNTDAEFKLLTAIADDIDMHYDKQVEAYLYLYSELEPCESCEDIIRQFKEEYSNIKVEVFWDWRYLPQIPK